MLKYTFLNAIFNCTCSFINWNTLDTIDAYNYMDGRNTLLGIKTLHIIFNLSVYVEQVIFSPQANAQIIRES